jgi:hypothetical protein
MLERIYYKELHVIRSVQRIDFKYKVTTLIPKLCKKVILKNTSNDFKEKSLHTAFRNICFSREMKPRYLLWGHKMREDSSHSKHVHDGSFLFKQTDDLHKAKLLCICFNYSRNKACFCLEISNAMRLFVMEHIRKSFDTGLQEMFWIIGTIGFITYAKARIPYYMRINWIVDVGGQECSDL